jgi:hypothetical protein
MEGVSMVRAVMFAAVLLFPASPAAAQFYDAHQLAKVEQVQIHFFDSDVNGCLPQAHTLKAEAELALRSAGIELVQNGNPLLTHVLNIEQGGGPIAYMDACLGILNVTLWRAQKQHDGIAAMVVAASDRDIFVRIRGEFPRRFLESANEKVTALANEILKARQR